MNHIINVAEDHQVTITLPNNMSHAELLATVKHIKKMLSDASRKENIPLPHERKGNVFHTTDRLREAARSCSTDEENIWFKEWWKREMQGRYEHPFNQPVKAATRIAFIAGLIEASKRNR